jgi:hypothetical protein
MRGGIRKRYRGSWNLILELRRARDPVTGHIKRRQKWVFRIECDLRHEAGSRIEEGRGAGPAS